MRRLGQAIGLHWQSLVQNDYQTHTERLFLWCFGEIFLGAGLATWYGSTIQLSTWSQRLVVVGIGTGWVLVAASLWIAVSATLVQGALVRQEDTHPPNNGEAHRQAEAYPLSPSLPMGGWGWRRLWALGWDIWVGTGLAVIPAESTIGSGYEHEVADGRTPTHHHKAATDDGVMPGNRPHDDSEQDIGCGTGKVHFPPILPSDASVLRFAVDRYVPDDERPPLASDRLTDHYSTNRSAVDAGNGSMSEFMKQRINPKTSDKQAEAGPYQFEHRITPLSYFAWVAFRLMVMIAGIEVTLRMIFVH